jgi:tetratricopeptide (TPR) repeat protein
MKILKNKITYLAFGVLVVLLFIIFEYSFVDNKAEKMADMIVRADRSFQGSSDTTYNIVEADNLYHKILEQDPSNENALYQLARVHYVTGEFQESFKNIERFKRLYPENKRIYYVSGLANAYADNLDISISEFKTFVDSDIVNEAGYLDLAWVYFKKSDFENSKKYLEQGMEEFGDNAWLNTSLGMTYFNLGNKEEALSLLEKAKKQADDITPEIWKINYSSNDPNNYLKDIQKFKDIIALNISIVNGEEDINIKDAQKTVGLPFESLSSQGLASGYAVSACCASNVGYSCSSVPNACGETMQGFRNCLGTCLAPTPADPPWIGIQSSYVCEGLIASSQQCGGIRNVVGTKKGCGTCPVSADSNVYYGFYSNKYHDAITPSDAPAWSFGGLIYNPSFSDQVKQLTDDSDGLLPWLGPFASNVCEDVEFIETRCTESRVAKGTKAGCPSPTKRLNLECSLDKFNWNDCTSVIKLSHSKMPFYIRNFITTGNSLKTYCTESVNVVENNSIRTGQDLVFKKIIPNNNGDLEFSQVNVAITSDDSEIITREIYGACESLVASKTLKIKIINIDVIEI